MPIGGDDRALFIPVAGLLRHRDSHASRHGHVAFKIQQTLAGEVNGHQGSGTKGPDGVTGSLQIQFIGNYELPENPAQLER